MHGTKKRLPRLGILYDVGSASPVDIFTASRRTCEPVFILNGPTPDQGFGRPFHESLDRRATCDITGLRTSAAVELLADNGVDQIMTFSERQLQVTADIAQHAGMRFLSVEAAALCRDKLRQRRALAEAGVDVVRARAVTGPEQLADAIAEVGLPVVIKPRKGMGSVDTVRMDTLTEAQDWLRSTPRRPSDGFVVEELLLGDPAQAGHAWGDYVSVESVVENGVVHNVCVTGKFPLCQPFREAGMVIPATIGPKMDERVRSVTTHAVRALGIDTGVTHTELKLTATGPRVIEVNARLGGYVAEILYRATGFNLVAAALRNAVGLPLRSLPATPDTVAYQYFLQPPHNARRLVSVAGLDALTSIPGVRRFDLRVEPESPVDWRWGTDSLIGVLYGEAPDHDSLLASVSSAVEALAVTYA